MEKDNSKWPTIHTTVDDKAVIDAIRNAEGYLRVIDIKSLLLIAASIAVEKELPPNDGINGPKTDTISYANLNAPSYEEYRHYICAIYYLTKGEKNIQNMYDVTDMAKNFEDYAHRGLIYLRDNYLEAKDGNNELFTDYVKKLSSNIKK